MRNHITAGTIPDEWGHLPYLEYVDISGTRMSCCTTQEQVDDPSFPNLPSFLQFSKRYSQVGAAHQHTKLAAQQGACWRRCGVPFRSSSSVGCWLLVRFPSCCDQHVGAAGCGMAALQFDLSTPNGGTLMTSDAEEGDGRQPNNIL